MDYYQKSLLASNTRTYIICLKRALFWVFPKLFWYFRHNLLGQGNSFFIPTACLFQLKVEVINCILISRIITIKPSLALESFKLITVSPFSGERVQNGDHSDAHMSPFSHSSKEVSFKKIECE